MNTFYKKLEKFGELVQSEVEKSGSHLEERFSVVHPGPPVFSREHTLTPQLKFEQSCTLQERRKVMQLYRKAFKP